jgi:hypothetical protein
LATSLCRLNTPTDFHEVPKDCGFVGPDYAYSFKELLCLYIDYRSDTYNLDRCAVEPGYVNIKDKVGKSQEEIECRLSNIDHLINIYTDINKINTVLDWGGGEGKFIPRQLQNKTVTILDVSNEPLISQTYSRLNELPADSKFDYLQVCHVLEHVSEPFTFMKEALSHVNDGGIVYLEVPQDKTDAEMNKFLDESGEMWHTLHEHINLYNIHSVEMLGKALGLKKLHVGVNRFNFGWCKTTVVSGVFSKPKCGCPD